MTATGTKPLNAVKDLNFSSPHISAVFVDNPRDYYVAGETVAVNPARTDLTLGARFANVIPPFSSVILRDVTIVEGDSVVLLGLHNMTNLGDIILERGWALYGSLLGDAAVPTNGSLPFPRNTPLYRSAQDDIGRITFDPWQLPGQHGTGSGDVRFLVKVNLWFAPADTDCFIHNQHNFIEIHSQVTGFGRMQKFFSQDETTLYHDEKMSPGYSTPVPFCEVKGPTVFAYPWHRYYADTDCIWMAVEYHPAL